MAINFSNNISIDLQSDVDIINSQNSIISKINSVGVSSPGLPFAVMYYNGMSDVNATWPQNSYPGGAGGVAVWPGLNPHKWNEPLYWNSQYINRRTGIFVCPVPGLYRMSIMVLAVGSNGNLTDAGRRSCIHFYPQRNAGGIGVNGAHQCANSNLLYQTIQAWVTVSCSAGDTLQWVANEMYGAYTGTWTVATYNLLP